jgi:hypothetical protein
MLKDMYDLTPYFLEAASKAETCFIDKMFRIVDNVLSTIPDLETDWQFEELEIWSNFAHLEVDWRSLPLNHRTWLTIKNKQKAISFLRIDMPLIILLNEYLVLCHSLILG